MDRILGLILAALAVLAIRFSEPQPVQLAQISETTTTTTVVQTQDEMRLSRAN